MQNLILSSLYFILPAYFANMAPVLFAQIPFTKIQLPLGKPIDESLFGSHKTWRGFYLGFLGALLILFIQRETHLSGSTSLFSPYLLDYSQINLFLYAFLFGIGALSGDLTKSFLKRKLKIKPGAPWFPFDQLDFVIGALILTSFFNPIPLKNILTVLLITPLLHFLTNIIGYFLGLKKVWW